MPDPATDPNEQNAAAAKVLTFTEEEYSSASSRIHTGGRLEGSRRTASEIAEVGKKYGLEINSDDPKEVARVLDAQLAKLTAPKGRKGAQGANEGDTPDVEQITRERDELLARTQDLEARYDKTVIEGAITRAIATADVADAELAFAGFTREYDFKTGKNGEIEVLKNGQRVREGYKDLTVEEAFSAWIKTRPVLLRATGAAGRTATDRGAGAPVTFDPKNPPKPGSPEALEILKGAGLRK